MCLALVNRHDWEVIHTGWCVYIKGHREGVLYYGRLSICRKCKQENFEQLNKKVYRIDMTNKEWDECRKVPSGFVNVNHPRLK